jgi:E3 ubiquitin-protein ligase HECTD2
MDDADPAPLSANVVKPLIESCIDELLVSLEQKDPREQGYGHIDNGGDAGDHLSCPGVFPDCSEGPPSRPPPPPPVQVKPGRQVTRTQDQRYKRLDDSRNSSAVLKTFKRLEDYIKVSFSSRECLNASFVEQSGPESHDIAVSASVDEAPIPIRDTSTVDIPVTANPGEREALMLTMARGPVRSRHERASKTHDTRPNIRVPPVIDWKLAQQFYDIVLTAGKDAEPRLSRHVQGASRYDNIRRLLDEARMEVARVLLRSTEILLKRPGKSLKRPEDIRFLLVILANPLLFPGSSPWSANELSAHPASQNAGSSSSKPSAAGRNTVSVGSGHHSGLLKRIFGLLSNLPNECHHYLISWFSIMPLDDFRNLVELGGSFTTYRIARHDNRKTGSNFRARLPYSDDWQIKATARVMSLLEKANTNSLGRRGRSAKGNGAGTALYQESLNRGQMIPSNAFYNMRLDYCDLIADFDVWESKSAKFCFCQYPFFLSMGAKIQILEHDAKRQMEVQARNAFINSISNRTALSQYMVLKVRRECLVEDSLKGISESVGTMDDIKKGLRVEFLGEDGIDAGGLKKEWFLMVAREVFDPNHGISCSVDSCCG